MGLKPAARRSRLTLEQFRRRPSVRERMMLLFDIRVLIARAASFILGGLHRTAVQAIIPYSVAGALIHAAIILAVSRVVDSARPVGQNG